jgi:hypothetical protein
MNSLRLRTGISLPAISESYFQSSEAVNGDAQVVGTVHGGRSIDGLAMRVRIAT